MISRSRPEQSSPLQPVCLQDGSRLHSDGSCSRDGWFPICDSHSSVINHNFLADRYVAFNRELSHAIGSLSHALAVCYQGDSFQVSQGGQVSEVERISAQASPGCLANTALGLSLAHMGFPVTSRLTAAPDFN